MTIISTVGIVKVPKEKDFEGNLRICAHNVHFSYWGMALITDENKRYMTEEAEECATNLIIQGYVAGELSYEDETTPYMRGWWEIVKE
jgi:hypothetical protein